MSKEAADTHHAIEMMESTTSTETKKKSLTKKTIAEITLITEDNNNTRLRGS